MNEAPNIRVICETRVLWHGYNDFSEMDEVTTVILRKYGPIDIYLQFAPLSMSEIQRYFINNIEVALEEADTVWRCLQPRNDTLMGGDFVDLDEVEKILTKVQQNRAP